MVVCISSTKKLVWLGSDLWNGISDSYEIKFVKTVEIGIYNEIIFQHLDVFFWKKKFFSVKSANCVFTYQIGYYIFKNDQFHEIHNVFIQDKIFFKKTDSLLYLTPVSEKKKTVTRDFVQKMSTPPDRKIILEK